MVYAYSQFNLGDDLFIKILCERYPKTKFVLYAPKDYKISMNSLDNLSVLPSDNVVIKGINVILRKVIKSDLRRVIAKKCDIAVRIGGSLFMQNMNWKRNYIDRKNMHFKNQPIFLLGSNFGPYKDDEFYLKYQDLFKRYTDICFREQYSYNLFNNLNNVRMADDIVFQLKKKNWYQKENNIVISVIKPSKKEQNVELDTIYYNKIKEISTYFIEKNYQVTLMSFCESEGDQEAVEEIVKLIPKKYLNKISKHFYRLNINETLDVIAKSSFVIASRFHAMILGWVYNKPVLPIAYSNKMTNVMKDVGFTGLYTDFNNISSLIPEEVFESMKFNSIDISKQVKNAEKHFEKLDEYLN